jgi:hypothetical protein
MTAPVPFGMKFIPILDLLQACIEVGSFLFLFSLTYFKATRIKKIYSTAQAFQTPTTYLCPTKNPKPRRHSRTEAMLPKRCYISNATKDGAT